MHVRKMACRVLAIGSEYFPAECEGKKAQENSGDLYNPPCAVKEAPKGLLADNCPWGLQLGDERKMLIRPSGLLSALKVSAFSMLKHNSTIDAIREGMTATTEGTSAGEMAAP